MDQMEALTQGTEVVITTDVQEVKEKKKRPPGKLAICPNPICGEKIPVKKDPHTCPKCQTMFNVVVRTVQIHLTEFDKEKMDEVISFFHRAGQWFIAALKARKNQWRIVEKEKGICALCEKEGGLVFEHDGKHVCSKCGSDRLYGPTARKELMLLAKKALPEITRATMLELALKRAQSMFGKWLKENWGPFIGEAKRNAFFEQCKERARNLGPYTGENKVLKILSTIRMIGANSKTSQCFLQLFQAYVRGRRINQRYRTKRRKLLQSISRSLPRFRTEDVKQGKPPKRKPSLPKLALRVVEPICGGCPNLEIYLWGPECKLHNWRLNPPPTQYPAFPSNVASLQKETYWIFPDHIELYLAEKGVKHIAKVLGEDWLKTYGYPNFDNTVYPHLWRRDTGKEIQYYLMYTVTDIVPLSQGPWTHIIACAPTTTGVFSVQDNGQSMVHYFNHGHILDVKNYHYQQRKRAKEKKKPRKAIIKASHLSHKKLQKLLALERRKGPSKRLETLEAIHAQRKLEAALKNARQVNDEQRISELTQRLNEIGTKERKLVMYHASDPAQPLNGKEADKPEEKAQTVEVELVDEDRLELPPPRRRRSGFFRFPRLNESHQVNAILHDETREITDYLAPFPGTAIRLHMGKTQYKREELDRKGFNQSLSHWPEARLRELLYKLLLVGFHVKTEPFDLQGLAICPSCKREAGGKWQDLIIVKGYRSINCACGVQTNITLAMAVTAFQAMQAKEETKAA